MGEIREYIEIFYNRQRIQAKLGYLSPAGFARLYQSQEGAKEGAFGVRYWHHIPGYDWIRAGFDSFPTRFDSF